MYAVSAQWYSFYKSRNKKMYFMFSVQVLMHTVYMYVSTNVLIFSECGDLNKK